MTADLPAGALLDLLDGAAEAQVLDLGHPPTGVTDDVVMVMLRQAGDVGVIAGRQVDPLEDLELGEELERTEDGRPADTQIPGSGILDEVTGREVACARCDQLGYHATRLGQAVAGATHGVDEWLSSSHLP